MAAAAPNNITSMPSTYAVNLPTRRHRHRHSRSLSSSSSNSTNHHGVLGLLPTSWQNMGCADCVLNTFLHSPLTPNSDLMDRILLYIVDAILCLVVVSGWRSSAFSTDNISSPHSPLTPWRCIVRLKHPDFQMQIVSFNEQHLTKYSIRLRSTFTLQY